ncbi:carboxypeptidase-like regulatory domain-containing protein [Haliangium sp.]|uniref:carboxypeptidase-like regulatory domain-containing protein n=1 Tax=Haliangium sp. TaxID=2663208 RepID=UPI003D0990AA
MTTWVRTGAPVFNKVSQVAVRLVDEFTGEAPIGPVGARLEAKDDAGQWHRADHARCVLTPSAVVVCPGLERHTRVATPVQPRRYRLVIEAKHYLPLYPSAGAGGLELDVYPNDDAHPPPVPSAPQDLYLVPAPSYPFASQIRVLRGRVVDQGGVPVAGAFVREGSRERVLTDDRGEFGLPLRWPAQSATLSIDADDRAGRTGSLPITLPAALGQGQTVVIH